MILSLSHPPPPPHSQSEELNSALGLWCTDSTNIHTFQALSTQSNLIGEEATWRRYWAQATGLLCGNLELFVTESSCWVPLPATASRRRRTNEHFSTWFSIFHFSYFVLQLCLFFIFSNSLLKFSCNFSHTVSILFLRSWVIFMIILLKPFSGGLPVSTSLSCSPGILACSFI